MKLGRTLIMMAMIFAMTSAEAAAQSLSSMEYGLEAMSDWSSCTACSSVSSLSYTQSQINQLDTELNSDGMSKKFKFFNNYVWPSDLIEDYLGGLDYAYGDGVELYAISSHGMAPIINSTVQLYRPTMCNASGGTTCYPYTDQMVFGEQSTSTYGATHSGRALWLILATCHSVDTSPGQQWKLPFQYGLEMVMGYKGTSADSPFTDEVLADFAENAFGGESKFKQVWFSATEDWYIDDTAGIITCHGTNTGTTTEELTNRLSNYRRTWPKRYNDGTERACAYAYHEG